MPRDLKCITTHVRKLAQEHPDAVYHRVVTEEMEDECEANCLYLQGTVQDSHGNDVGEGCIVGQASLLCGFTEDELKAGDEDDGKDAGWLMKHLGVIEVNPAEVTMLPKPVRWLRRVQSNQDGGKAWGEAITLADEEYPPAQW